MSLQLRVCVVKNHKKRKNFPVLFKSLNSKFKLLCDNHENTNNNTEMEQDSTNTVDSEVYCRKNGIFNAIKVSNAQ